MGDRRHGADEAVMGLLIVAGINTGVEPLMGDGKHGAEKGTVVVCDIDEAVMGLLIVAGGLNTDAFGREGGLTVISVWSVAAGVDFMAGTGRTVDV